MYLLYRIQSGNQYSDSDIATFRVTYHIVVSATGFTENFVDQKGHWILRHADSALVEYWYPREVSYSQKY